MIGIVKEKMEQMHKYIISRNNGDLQKQKLKKINIRVITVSQMTNVTFLWIIFD